MITPKDVNYNIGKPVAVGSYKANGFGLYDMHGNVWEWCEDLEHSAGAISAATGDRRVLKGGSFDGDGSYSRSSYRHFGPPTIRLVNDGFRLARTK